MRETTRRKLDAIQSGERWSIVIGSALLFGCWVAIAGSWELTWGQPREIAAAVKSVKVSGSQDVPHPIVTLELDLDDGRYVIASAHKSPAPGSRVIVREQVNWFGYHRFVWDGVAEHARGK